MPDTFRIALTGDFRRADGSPAFPDFDISPLQATPRVEVLYLENADPIQSEQVAGIDALILQRPRFGRESIHSNGRLSVVARFGVGYDNVDVGACTEGGIPLVITPDGPRRPVAVSIITLMLALTGKLLLKDKLTRGGPGAFNQRAEHMGVGLVGRTLGSLGIGNIGTELFRLATPFDMKFIAHDPYADRMRARELGVELTTLEDVFRRSDVLCVNCPLTQSTRHLVNAERLSLMKSTAFLINTARGPIVDQKALTRVLRERRIAGAGLDVFESEPPEPDDPLLRLENTILAPHALCWTDQCFAGNGAADVRAVLDVQQGRVPRDVVNRVVLDDPRFKGRLEAYRTRFGA